MFSRAVDIYSYGMVYYEILTRKLPFEDHLVHDFAHVLVISQHCRSMLKNGCMICWCGVGK